MRESLKDTARTLKGVRAAEPGRGKMDNLGVAPVFGERATWSILRKYFSAFDPIAQGEIQWQERKTKSDQ